jgi:hypothetical protein
MRPFKKASRFTTSLRPPSLILSKQTTHSSSSSSPHTSSFLEQKRTFVNKAVFPDFGLVPGGIVQDTAALGGPLYEARKLLEYRDVSTTLDEFKDHFLDMFAKNFPNYSYVSLDLFVTALRQFYSSARVPVTAFKWFFRTLFNSDAEVYFPRTDVLKASDGTWFAPKIVKVTTPTDGHPNSAVGKFYIGQRVQTPSGTAQVESVISYVVGQAFNQNISVNELTLKFGSLLGTFVPGETLVNIDSTEQVATTVLPQIFRCRRERRWQQLSGRRCGHLLRRTVGRLWLSGVRLRVEGIEHRHQWCSGR